MELTLAEIRGAEDIELGTSDWFRIDQGRITAFAEATEDRQWIHLDAERAAQGHFGGTIAHGYLVLSLVPKLFAEIVDFPDIGMLVNYGLDKLRFLAPVPTDGEVRLKAHLVSAQERSGGALMRVRGEIELRATGRRAVIAELLFLALPASGSSSDASPPSAP